MDPPMNVGDEAYFEAAAAGKLVVKKCGACGKAHHYPRTLCPFCFSDDLAWHDAKGTGTIYSYSVMRRGSPVPYCIAYVTLDEGVTMMTNLVDCDFNIVGGRQGPRHQAGGHHPHVADDRSSGEERRAPRVARTRREGEIVDDIGHPAGMHDAGGDRRDVRGKRRDIRLGA